MIARIPATPPTRPRLYPFQVHRAMITRSRISIMIFIRSSSFICIEWAGLPFEKESLTAAAAFSLVYH